MAPPGTDVKMAGVAEGKKLIGTPTGDDVAPMDRVRALFVDTLSKEIYDVSAFFTFYCFTPRAYSGELLWMFSFMNT